MEVQCSNANGCMKDLTGSQASMPYTPLSRRTVWGRLSGDCGFLFVGSRHSTNCCRFSDQIDQLGKGTSPVWASLLTVAGS